MRIIAGQYKGRKLYSWNKKLPVRPMTDRVKETVFNVLSPYFFESCKVLDLFSGTGNLSLEAFSRGAKEVHAVEKNSLCLQIIKKNSHFLDSSQKFILHKKNVFSFLKKHLSSGSLKKDLNKDLISEKVSLLKKNKSSPLEFDIVLIDPPFKLKAGESIMTLLTQSDLVYKNTVIAIETCQKEFLNKSYFNFHLFSLKSFKDKKVCFYKTI